MVVVAKRESQGGGGGGDGGKEREPREIYSLSIHDMKIGPSVSQ